MTELPVLLRLLVALVVVASAAHGAGKAVARLRQPPVIGEMIAGILLGPSLFGRLFPGAFRGLFAPDLLPSLRSVAQVGVVIFLFLVGLELDAGHMRTRTRTALTIALAGMAVPLTLGAGVGAALADELAPYGVSALVFVAFFAVAMSVTAFPVLARIVEARGLRKTPLGVLALTCAAFDDACAWCMLAIVVGLARAGHGTGATMIVLTVGYVGVMALVVRPLLVLLSSRVDARGAVGPIPVLILGVALLASALATEWIGIHALFGAFLLGALLPSEGRLAHSLIAKLEKPVRATLLPVFFAFTGLRTQVALVSGPHAWMICGLVISAAFLGKLGGVSITARLLGLGHRRAAALGALMNTRGLMELVVLNVGLDLGIISPSLFAMMVIMALVTTIAAGPLLDFIGSDEPAPEATSSPRAAAAD